MFPESEDFPQTLPKFVPMIDCSRRREIECAKTSGQLRVTRIGQEPPAYDPAGRSRLRIASRLKLLLLVLFELPLTVAR